MPASSKETFKRRYQTHLKHLKLKGLQPKTIEAYSRAIRRIGAYFDHRIEDLSEQQLIDYFTDLLESHSWSAVKLDLYGLKFFYTHVLHKPWENIHLIKPPKTQRLPDIVTVDEAKRLFTTTHTLSYRVFYFTAYSLGLRLGEGLRLQVGDIDATRQRVHIHDAKGNKDRLVPLPEATLDLLRRFWQVHRNPVLVFPNRQGDLKGAGSATTPLDRGGVQTTLHKVVEVCGIKKDYPSQPTPQLCDSLDRGRCVDLLEGQKILGHHSILTTAKYTHLTSTTQHNASAVINESMNGFSIEWGTAK
jgi:site-specific recombinase XerD